MIDQARLLQIKQLVQTSSILTTQEKQDWLALTSLMNDKQIAELEEILKTPQPTPVNQVAPISQPVKPVTTSPASQFNRPATPPQVSKPLPPQAPRPVTPVPPQRSNTQGLRPMQSSGPLPPKPSSSSLPLMSTKATAMPHISNMPSQLSTRRSSPITAPVKPKLPMEDSENVSGDEISVQAITSRVRPMGRDEDSNLMIQGINDVINVSSSVLGGPYRSEFYQKLLALVSQYGYFQVITNLEQSPLYKDYLEYGRQKLAGGVKGVLPLSQEEFEFITDLLLSLKINRV